MVSVRNRVLFCIIVILKMHDISYELQGHRIHHIISCCFLQEYCAIKNVLPYILFCSWFVDHFSLSSCLVVRDEVWQLFIIAGEIILLHVMYRVITVVSDGIIIFWDVAVRNLVVRYQHFGFWLLSDIWTWLFSFSYHHLCGYQVFSTPSLSSLLLCSPQLARMSYLWTKCACNVM